jgi:hypothetical protein
MSKSFAWTSSKALRPGRSRNTKTAVSLPPPFRTIVDTNVLRYFLFVDRTSILATVLGRPMGVPRLVYDPDEGEPPENAMSEIRRSILVQRERGDELTRSDEGRAEARRNASRLSTIDALLGNGDVVTVDMSREERELFAALTDHNRAGDFGLKIAPGHGEAACVAIAVERSVILATNDADALTAYERLAPKGAHARIRGALRDAAEGGLISRATTNATHIEMTRLGLWDIELPFSLGELEDDSGI